MGFTINDIAAALDATIFGASDIVVTGAAEPAMAGPDDLALAMDPKYADGLARDGPALRSSGMAPTGRRWGLKPPSSCRARVTPCPA